MAKPSRLTKQIYALKPDLWQISNEVIVNKHDATRELLKLDCRKTRTGQYVVLTKYNTATSGLFVHCLITTASNLSSQ